MGFYIRKSARIGPFRLNLSKSGVGVSVGVRGFRVSSGPRGAMIHMGRHGIYYRKSIGKRRRRNPTGTKPQRNRDVNLVDGLTPIDSESVDQIVDVDSKEVVDLIRETRQRFKTAWLTIPFLALAYFDPVFVVLATLYLVVALIVDKKRRTVHLAYDISDEMEHKIQHFYDEFRTAFTANAIWHISASGGVSDWKKSGGADRTIRRSKIRIAWGSPKGIHTNVKTPSIPVGTQTLHFFPDMVLIIEKKAVGTVAYSHLKVVESIANMLEEDTRPKDATQVGTTWKYVNKNGGPDRRFKANYQIPILEYAQIDLSSESGLREVVQVSTSANQGTLTKAIAEIRSTVVGSASPQEDTV